MLINICYHYTISPQHPKPVTIIFIKSSLSLERVNLTNASYVTPEAIEPMKNPAKVAILGIEPRPAANKAYISIIRENFK